ncbi:hypothetical protein A9Q79_06960 [Methylophaga sp. 42_25_T18]|nr:hypothetical protein A9Q79_06960 [Methylophaga sp. 42_25_T18]OUR89708.1 hypothetical protein A9Q92_00670 [Methylophaga sp. 42_8_T64]
MKFSLETVADKNQIQSYGHGHMVVTSNNNSESIQLDKGLILSPNQIITDREAQSASGLSESDISLLKSLELELLIFVSDPTISSLSPEIVVAFNANGIGVETMALGPACRTYNLVIAEGRRVALVVNV